ncbi:MAG TPA: TonB-dependent receptor [Thermoanaerobaculia bacterium]|jgi:outer membrane receptor protein involved in Fe transport|nr:TonB-dependent receptor [Thermoanaerobaculia bacterium]
MRRVVVLLFAIGIVFTWPLGARAQSACEDALRDAEKSYELGLFEDVPVKVAPCMGTPMSRTVAVHVHSLLARAYVNNDETEKARKEISTLLRLQSNYEPEAGSTAGFVALLAKVRAEEQTTQVVSVSKTSESLREAPATVVVITGDEIAKRGYLDLEQLLHDLPGFDIARLNGAYYSSIYQRGYVNSENDRLLLLVDGVEQNDLQGSTAYISRQYSLSDVERVEVIYGPASTMYGANAYTGVISIVTRDPETILGDNRRFGLIGHVTDGGYSNRAADVTAAGMSHDGTTAWSVAGRFQQSKERDLSALDPSYDFTYRNVDYKSLMHLDATDDARQKLCSTPSPYIACSAQGIDLTDAGEALVRGLDRKLIQDHNAGFDDGAKNASINAKMRIQNLTAGLQWWSSQEGIVSAYGTPTGITGNTSWNPKELALYVKYSIPFDRFKLNLFSRYEETTLARDTSRFDYVHSYYNGFLNLYSLVSPCVASADPQPVGCAPASPWIERDTFGLLNSALRSEASLIFQPSETLSGVTGVEFAKSSIQTQYDSTPTGPGYLSQTSLEKPEDNEHTDLAMYAQGAWKPRKSLRVIVAGRVNHNSIDNKPDVHGYGTLFTPRLGVIWSSFGGRLILKSIYSEAFKDPTDEQKFSVLRYVYAVPSNGLVPERVRNFELSANWQRGEALSIDAAAYRASYAHVVGLGAPRNPDGSLITDCEVDCRQFQNRNRFLIRGAQLTASYRLHGATLWTNYTHTESLEIDPANFDGSPMLDANGNPLHQLPIADIAKNQVTLGFDTDADARLFGGARVHYVGRRRTGVGTLDANSFFVDNPFTQMAPYSTTDATLNYRVRASMTLQLSAFNLFDKQYYDPGNFTTLPRVLQAGRTIDLRLLYRLPQHERR